MAEIPGSGIEEIALNQTEIVSLINDHLWRLWVMLKGAISVANEPAGGESNGDSYIVGSSPTGSFSAFSEDDVAILLASSWTNLTPEAGWRIWVIDESVLKVYGESGGWMDYP